MDESKIHSGEPLSLQPAEEDNSNRRRCTRLLVAVPVTISGQNARGEAFCEEARTIVVHPQGASIVTSQSLVPGSEINIENRPLRIAVRARVARFVKGTSSTGFGQIDVELVEPKNIWGIRYPPADWQKVLPGGRSGQAAPVQTQLSLAARIKPPTQPASFDQPPAAARQAVRAVPSDLPAGSAAGHFALSGWRHAQAPNLEAAKFPNSEGREDSIEAQRLSSQSAAGHPLEEQEDAVRSLTQRLAEASARAEKSAVHLEELASKIEETRRQAHIQTEQAQKCVHEAVEEAFQAIRRETDKNLSQGIESIRSGFLEETRRMAADQASALSQEFKHEIDGSLSGVVAEHLLTATTELDARQSRALEDTQERAGRLLATRLQDFQQELQQNVQGLQESALSTVVREGAARVALECESKQAEILEQAGAQARDVMRSALEDFQAQLRQSAEDLRQSAAAAIAAESAAKAAVEIQARQAEIAGQAQVQIQTVVRVEIESFQAQLRQSAEDLRESAAAAIAGESAAKVAAEIQAQQVEITSQIDTQLHLAMQTGLDAIQARIQQAEQTFRDSTLPTLTHEYLAQSIAANEASQAEIVEQAQSQMRSIMDSSVKDFEAESARATNQFRESVLPVIAKECAAASAEEMRQVQHEAVRQTAEQIQDVMQAALNGFEERLRGSEQTLKERADELLRAPAQQINQYTEDAVIRVREGLSSLRASEIELAQSQLSAMTRGALTSMTEEVKATMEEYRNQIREILDGLRERSASTVDSYIKEALDHSRESVMQRLQKDTEDFSSVAVAQFHSRSGEAVKEATDAIHKQVGSAAFVVKDWLDQAAQQMEARFAKLEARSNSALEAIDHRSQDLSCGVLDRFQKESEAVLASLRVRIQNAVKALETPDPAAAPAAVRSESSAQRSQELPEPAPDR